MPSPFVSLGIQSRLLMTRLMTRLGLREHYVLLPMAIIVGVVTAAAAVAFHAAINGIRDVLYAWQDPNFLYGRGVWMLVLLPALGGLVVGLITVYVARAREGHGIVDVMESVIRNRGVIRPISAIEKIITSAITIGTGGSAGAEGPIVQIGAAIASGVGMIFQVARSELPILVACGSAAGISAIFNAPIGGVLFTLEVILLDFSIRAFAPVVLCSVISNVTMHAIFSHVLKQGPQHAIFDLPPNNPAMLAFTETSWGSVPGLLLLGLACGIAGVSLTRLMYRTDELFHRIPLRPEIRPALGGALLGLIGVLYVMIFGWAMLGQSKPVQFEHYPMPSFFGDGYGAVQMLLDGSFHPFPGHPGKLVVLLLFLCVAKVVGSSLTLGSGGSGGVIAPSLFLGATTGALFGALFGALGEKLHLVAHEPPEFYAIIGMGAVLAAVVHGPLSSILILFEITGQRNIILPAMLACVVATGTARMIFPDSVYTLTLKRRGVRIGTGADLTVLRRITIEQLTLEPVTLLPGTTPLERLVELSVTTGASDFCVCDSHGEYIGLVVADDVKTALIDREAIPLLLAGDLARPDLPCVTNTDDLASVLEIFSRYEVARLPVCLSSNRKRIIGLVSRRALMNEYHSALQK